MRLLIDNRVGNRNADFELEGCSVEQAIMMFEKLNGKEHTLLSIERDDGWQLCVGGGREGYVVTMSSQEDENYTLLNKGCVCDDLVELCAGGQFSEFPLGIVVNETTAARAIYSFFSEGEDGLSWEQG